MYQFCSRACADDYKKLHCIVTYCEYCQEEKTLHETVNFSGIRRPFCSEGLYVFVFFLRYWHYSFTAVDLLCSYVMLKFKVTTHFVVLEAKPEVSSLLLMKCMYLLIYLSCFYGFLLSFFTT